MPIEHVVRRRVAPTHVGVILHFVKTTAPVPGELVYHGEFTSRKEVWGLNEPVTAWVCDPVGEYTVSVFEPAAAREIIVQRMFAPGIPRYVKTDRPIDGEFIYFGQFLERSVTFGLIEPVRADICEPIGDVVSQKFFATRP